MTARQGFFAIVLATGLTAAAPARPDTVLTLNVWPSPKHNLMADVMIPWSKRVTEATHGRVRFRLPAAPLARGAGIYDAVAGGVVDVSYAVHGYTPARFVFYRLVEFPFAANSATAASVVYWRMYEKYLARHDPHRGVKLLGLFTHGPGEIFTRDKPIRRISDFKGVKMRTGGGMQRDIAERLGAVIVAAVAPRNYEILSRGIADGTFLPLESLYKYNIDRFIHFHTRVPGGLYNTSFMLIMNPAKWAALSPADRAAMSRVSGEALARLAGASWDRLDAAARARMDKAEITVIPANAAFEAEIAAATAPIIENWERDMKAKRGLDGAQVLADFRAEVKRLERAAGGPDGG